MRMNLTRTLITLFLVVISTMVMAQSVNELIANYSGIATWDDESKTLSFETTGTVYFASKVGNGSNLEEDQKQNFWEVPSSVKKILIKKDVTVTCAFHTFGNITIEGEDRKSSIVFGTNIKRWADANNDLGVDLREWYYSQFDNQNGILTIKNLTSLNPFSYHIRGWGRQVHVDNCDIIDTRGGSQNHSDGFTGGDGSTVNNCYFETGDDVFKAYFDYTATNCTINMVDNAVPIQMGWGNYSNGSTVNFQNLTITGNSGRWSPDKTNAVIVGRRSGSGYNITVNIDGLYLENPNAHMVMLWEENMTLNGEIKNAYINIKGYTQTQHNKGTDNLVICGGAAHSKFYDCRVSGAAIPGKIEAEDFSLSDGVSTETCSDSDGGENITAISTGDWIEYDVIADPEGDYTIDFRVASAENDIKFNVYSNNELVARVEAPATGGNQTWTTVQADIEIPFGQQTIKIVAETEGWNMNWMDFKNNPTRDNIIGLNARYKSYKAIKLTWDVNGITDEVGFVVERKNVDEDLYQKIDTTTADVNEYIDSLGLNEFTLYTYRIRTLYADGISQASDSVLARTDVEVHATLPDSWAHLTIGDSMAMASTTIFENDTFTIDAGDGDYWTEKDRAPFVYKHYSGDCEIIAEITHYTPIEAFTQAGVMIRESTDPGSKFAAMLMMSDPGPIVRERVSTDGEVSQQFDYLGTNTPVWVRLKRVGNTFSGYTSPDGVNWKLARTTTVEMGADVVVGMAASSHTLAGPASFSFTNISVTNPKNEYTIEASSNSGGTIKPAGAITVLEGSNVDYEVMPDDHYSVVDVKVDNESQGAISVYTFESVAADHTISATFEAITYTITATAGENGSISPSGEITVMEGEDKTFTIRSEYGYMIDQLTVNGVVQEAENEYTFNDVSENSSIHVTFKKWPTSVDEIELRAVTVYPNPASNQLNIEQNQRVLAADISLLTVTGDVILQKRMVEQITTVDVSELPGGIYIFIYESKEKTYAQRIVVK